MLILAAACSSGGNNAPTPVATAPASVASPPQNGGQTTTLPASTATAPPALSVDRIQLGTGTSTRYYPVMGLTTAEIFDAIEKGGPRDGNGEKGIGLAAADWSYRWTPQPVSGGCVISTMTITLDVVVTLPRHQQEGSLSATQAANWDAFEASVAKHEQRHVDIHMEGARTIRDKMAAIKQASNCDELARQVNALWTGEQRAIEAAQERFHDQEDARIAVLRAPLQGQIDANRAKIASLAGQIQALDKSLAVINSDLTNVDSQLDALKSQLDALQAQYPNLVMPPDVSAQYEELRRLYNALAPSFNQLVSQYNSSIAQRNKVADEHDALVEATNLLVDQFNWIH